MNFRTPNQKYGSPAFLGTAGVHATGHPRRFAVTICGKKRLEQFQDAAIAVSYSEKHV